MNQNRPDIPIQPVEQPILCNPYEKPDAHWIYDTLTGEAVKQFSDGVMQAIGTKPNAPAAHNSKCFGKKIGTTSR